MYVSLNKQDNNVTETCCLQAQGLCKQQVPQKSWYLSSKLHSITSQQTVIFKALSFSYLLSINFFVIMCLRYSSGIWDSKYKYKNGCVRYATTGTSFCI